MPTELALGIGIGRGPLRAGAAVLGSPTLAQMTTAAETKQGDADMVDWASGKPLIRDQYGKLILWIQYFRQANSTKYHIPVVSNDGGATWTAPTRTGFFDANGDIALIRIAGDYDPTHDAMHCCIALAQSDGFAYYRQFSFTRDGSNNITGVTRTRQMNLEVGVAGMTCESPRAVWCDDAGKLWLSWSAANPAGVSSKAAIRAACRVVSMDASDVANANWTAPLNENAGAGATDAIASSFPAGQKMSQIALSASAAVPFGALVRTAAKDIAMVYSLGGGVTGSIYYNRLRWASATSDWRAGSGTGPVAAIANDSGALTIGAIGSPGYVDKHQLLSQLSEDAGGGVVGGYAGYSSGDRWLVYRVSSADALTGPVEVYNAGAAHSYAPTGDALWDPTAGRLIASFVKTTSQFASFKTYTQALALDQGEAAIDASHPVDIPYLAPRLNGRQVFYHRDTTGRVLPDKFYAYFGTGAWT